MEEENFASLNPEIVCETSGISVTPQLVRVLPGKCGVGVVFVIMIANVYFEMYQKQKSKKWILLRCSRYRVPDKCVFLAKIINLGNRLRSKNWQKFL